MGTLRIVSVLVVCCMVPLSSALAGNIDLISSRSPDFLRTMSRNAATDAPDIVSYNPAGLAFLAPGWHFTIGNQTLLKDYTVEAAPPGATEPELYESTEPSLLLPDVAAVYSRNGWAGFAAFTVPAGGGKLDFEDGLTVLPLFETGLQQAIHGSPYVFAVLDDGWITASSNYIAATAGASWNFAGDFAASLAGRFVSAVRAYDASGDFTVIDGAQGIPIGTSHRELHAEKKASGFGGVIGLHFSPGDVLDVAIRYETTTALEFTTETERNDWSAIPALGSFEDGYEQRRDLPAVLAGGVEYRMSPRLMATMSMNYYFLEAADQGADDGLDDNYSNGWDLGAGIGFSPRPGLDLGAGYLYSSLGGSDTTYSDFEYSLDAHLFGGGAKFEVSRFVSVSASVARLVCVEGEGAGTYEGSIYNKGVWYFGAGLDIDLVDYPR